MLLLQQGQHELIFTGKKKQEPFPDAVVLLQQFLSQCWHSFRWAEAGGGPVMAWMSHIGGVR